MLFLLLLACEWTVSTWSDPDRPGVVCYVVGSPLVQAAGLDCLYVPDPTGSGD